MARLELHDIQSGALRPRPTPFAATYWILRIDDRENGRGLMRRLAQAVSPADDPQAAQRDTWVSASLTYNGLKALGAPQASLDSFSTPFREGMAARAASLGDTGESAPERWEKPLGTPDVHVVITGIAPDRRGLDAALERARAALAEYPDVREVWHQDCHVLPGEREPFGFRDGMSHPAIEGSGIPGSNPHETPIKAGDFVLGYPGELHAPVPQPEVLGRNGTYVAFRKL
ncbi:MAG: peroxidase, partial [Candidatus Eremiobacteraeota bacterium]|nr:peroxidase [Candidatus Eremiobacteraeota bacterium]